MSTPASPRPRLRPPGPADWPDVSRDRDEYTRVRASGRFLHRHEAAVQAVTELGPGYWILTPLETRDFTVLVNRGFVPQDRRDPATRPAGQFPGEVTVAGLLRLSEPGGGFLRRNDPAADRWYSRDVAAIARGSGPRPTWRPSSSTQTQRRTPAACRSAA